MTYRNRKLLNLAHDAPCLAAFPHDCTEYKGVEPAHSDWSAFGRGAWHKSADWAFAAMCHTAHITLDTFDRETKRMEWLRAHVATQDWLWSNEKVRVA